MNDKLNQVLKNPATVVLTSRVDLRQLATLAKFWNDQGERPKSTSELVRLCLESFSEFLVLTQKAEFVQTQSDAKAIMEGLGLRVKKFNPRNMAEALAREVDVFDRVINPAPPDEGHQRTVRERPVGKDAPELEQARRVMEGILDEADATRVREAKECTQEFKDAMKVKEVRNVR